MIQLSDYKTTPPKSVDKATIKETTQQYIGRIGILQKVLRAESKHAVLVVLQGMDASGKDGAVYKIFRACSHNGVQTYSFGKPTEREMAHDFLWRVHQRVPAKGELMIFNRSHYEDILIQRVHQWISEERVAKRMQAINAFEELLAFDNNTTILKFFLHSSYEGQEEQLRQRIDEPEKNWKHNPNDWEERKHWKKYMECYEYVLNNSKIPWHIIPVDKRWYRDYCISKVVVEALEKLDLKYPHLSKS
ncbi:MAG: PPK2 family polyphosphate kinase [Bacteroidota bacterium]